MTDAGSFDLGLAGKVVVVTGGSRGIGRAVAKAFLDQGAVVRITARRAERLQEAAEALGTGCSWAVADVGDEDAARSVVTATVDELGAVDVLVNNAAMGLPYGPLVELEARRAAKAALVNQWAPVLWTRLAWEAWQAAHGGAIVNIASIGGLVPWPNAGYYGATKAALIHITRSLALELSPGVRVNAVAPAVVETEFSGAAARESDPSGIRRRPGRPDEVADLVVFLASERASLVNGATLVAADPAG